MAKRKDDVVIDKYKRESIDLKEFMLLDAKKQDEKIKKVLSEMYNGAIEITKKHVDKVLNICFDIGDNEVYLPKKLKVAKNGSKLIFAFKEKNNFGLFILFLLGFLFVGGAATYSGINYINQLKFNIDLDADGVADLNIDKDGDNYCDINCDSNSDNKPDQNIDYKGNRKPIFNVLQENETIINKINQDINGDGKCDINCDTNEDGWPDMNIDYNGDGIVDLDKDTNNDGIKDLNLDTNGDGLCDLNCDEDGNGSCDVNCITITLESNGGGTSSSTGNGGIEFQTASLIIIFASENAVVAKNLYPDDQVGQGVNTTVPDLKFTLENTTDDVQYYDLKWLIERNTFESTNFWYRVNSTNDGYNASWSTAPAKDDVIATHVAIAPHTIQSYTISLTLHGTGEEQNYDQGKIFDGKIEVVLEKAEEE